MKKKDKVTFAGYSDLEESETPVFEKGQTLIIDKVETVGEDKVYHCHLEGDESVKDECFHDEVTAYVAKDAKASTAKKKTAKKKTATKKTAASKDDSAAEVVEEQAPAKPVTVRKSKTKAKAAQAAAAPKANATQEAAPKADIMAAEQYTEDVVKVTKSDNSALKAAKALIDKINENYWTFGGVINYIKEHSSFRKFKNENGENPYEGNEGFRNYIEAELGVEYRKAMFYAQVYRTFAPLGLDPTRALAIGYTKLSRLCSLGNDELNKESVEGWLTQAEDNTRDELNEIIAEVKRTKVNSSDGESTGTGSSSQATAVNFKFRLFEDQGEVADAALKKAGELVGEDDLNAQFSHIMTDWLSMQGGEGISLEQAVEALENTYGVADITKLARSRYGKAK